jgi:hypothetical protein
METLDIFSRRACYYQNAYYRKMNGIKVVDKLSTCKVGSVHFLAQNSPKEATDLAKKRFKVKGFYGTTKGFLAWSSFR